MSEDQETKCDLLINDIFSVLPATTYEEIATRVSESRGASVTIGDVSNAIAHLRKHADIYGWTIPHAQRGIPTINSEGRYFALATNRSPDEHFDDEERRHLKWGRISTMMATATQYGNVISALELALPYERSLKRRENMKELADDLAYLKRKIVKVLAEMRDAA